MLELNSVVNVRPLVRKPEHIKSEYPCFVSDKLIRAVDRGIINSICVEVEKTEYIKNVLTAAAVIYLFVIALFKVGAQI